MPSKPSPGDVLNTRAYGQVTVGDVAEFDSVLELVLPDGSSAWTDYTVLDLEVEKA